MKNCLCGNSIKDSILLTDKIRFKQKGKILKFLREHNIKNIKNVTFYDDNQTVLKMLLDLGINAKDSIKINQELSK